MTINQEPEEDCNMSPTRKTNSKKNELFSDKLFRLVVPNNIVKFLFSICGSLTIYSVLVIFFSVITFIGAVEFLVPERGMDKIWEKLRIEVLNQEWQKVDKELIKTIKQDAKPAAIYANLFGGVCGGVILLGCVFFVYRGSNKLLAEARNEIDMTFLDDAWIVLKHIDDESVKDEIQDLEQNIRKTYQRFGKLYKIQVIIGVLGSWVFLSSFFFIVAFSVYSLSTGQK